ncbi:MAG: YcgN family cysteine cluster protein [Candidatus Magnetomorum sp.]|nr:YcgN family cysteine cluster protein [Candidatus Magnetomorum sp.]
MKTSPPFWISKPLNHFTYEEWERLCDRCGLCCIHKLEDQDGNLYLTDVACKYLDIEKIWCRCYEKRDQKQALCRSLTSENIAENLNWLPKTCAYRRIYENSPLPDWHPLISNDPDAIQKAGWTIQNKVVSERLFPIIDWEKHVVSNDYFDHG